MRKTGVVTYNNTTLKNNCFVKFNGNFANDTSVENVWTKPDVADSRQNIQSNIMSFFSKLKPHHFLTVTYISSRHIHLLCLFRFCPLMVNGKQVGFQVKT